jgi:general secretion pathway protein H
MTSRSERLDRYLDSDAGFTLVEVVVVLAILGLMLGLAMPFLGKSVGDMAQRAAVAELRVALQAADAEAIGEGHTVVFRIDPNGGYWIDRRYSRLAGAAARLRLAVAGTGRISFYPWGGSSGGRMWIEGPQGRREIAVDAVTGRAVISP